MAYQSLSSLLTAVFDHYQENRFAEALEVLQANAQDFPERNHDLQYYFMCLHGRLNQPELAIEYFKAAMDSGHFYEARALQEDDADLSGLFSHAEFRQLRDLSLQRYEAARAVSKPELLVQTPPNATSETPLLIALHGNRSNGRDTAGYWSKALDLGWVLASAQSSQVVSPNRYVWDNTETASAEVKQHYADICAEYQFDENCVIVGGFSRGAGLAIEAVLRQIVPARGFIAIAPALPDPESLAEAIAALKGSKIRGAMLIGSLDQPYIPVANTIAELMREAGLAVHYELREGLDHVYPDDFPTTLQDALKFVTEG